MATDEVVTLDIAAPLEHQEAMDQSPARHKLGRCGRRWGKTRFVFKAAIAGHGPDITQRVVYRGRRNGKPQYEVVQLDEPEPLHRGIASGMDVAWVVPIYKTANSIWSEEVLPRFRPLEEQGLVRINEADKYVQIIGAGKLFIVSGEAIDGIRGIGKNLIGVIYDEAAHADLEYAHKSVLVPMLTDNMGWTIYVSTTNAGLDGNTEQVAPSFFNRLCLEVQQGLRGSEWAEFTGTAYDNPALDPIAIDAMIAEYVPGSTQLDEEVYAKLLGAGAGLAFPEWRRELHGRDLEPELGWKAWAGCDWGYSSPGAFYIGYTGPNRKTIVRHEIYFNGPARQDWPRKLDAASIGRRIGGLCRKLAEQHPALCPDVIVLDSACWAVTDGGQHIAGKMQEGIDAEYGPGAPQLVPSPKGPGSRVARKLLLHELLAWEADEHGKCLVEAQPLFYVHSDCPHLRRTLPALPLSLTNPEDVETDSEDHAYDGVTYPLLATLPDYEAPKHDVETRAVRVRLDRSSLAEADAFDAMLERMANPRRR